MSLHLSAAPAAEALTPDTGSEKPSNSSEEEEEDQNWDDWESDSNEQLCQSLFESKTFQGVNHALAYDKTTHGFDLNETCSRLSLDFHQRIRLINFIRKTKPTPADLASLNGAESFLSSDEYLMPVLEDDPVLRVQSNDWSDSDDETGEQDASRRIRILEKKLASAKKDLQDYQNFVREQLNVTSLIEAMNEPSSSAPPAPTRDDDTHYFRSYDENDIHAVMIQDKVRTSSYASFILKNPVLFRDAIVLDVGCGTGILSLFAARAGARRVIAVDGSHIADRAAKIVKDNGLDNTITVIRGKVEEITLPDGITHVDIIISEWMGYALLYESMLDSVLHARDRFLRPDGGVMAPSQCKMMLALCEGSEILKERVGFWSDVHGFDLSAMAEDVYDEAIVEIVGPGSLLSAPYTVKDFHLCDITARQLDLLSSFTLISTSECRKKAYAFILYFDTFFTASGKPVPADYQCQLIQEGDSVLAEIWPVGGKPAHKRRQSQNGGLRGEKEKINSFSTGPKSIPTHWKQTIFLIREPICVTEGTVVSGNFYCRKSEANSRELEVEIHYSVSDPAKEKVPRDVVVQIYKVR